MENRHGPSFFQILLEAFNSLRLLGRRSVLALLGIAVGCASVVALLNIGHNTTNEAMNAFKELGANVLLVTFPSNKEIQRPIPATLDTAALHNAVPGVEYVAPIIQHFTPVRHEGHGADGNIIGSTADLFKALNFRLAQGRLLSHYDSRATYAMAGSSVAQALSLQVGSRVQVGGYIFEIVGIIESKPSNPMLPVRVDESIFIPMTGIRRVNPNPEISNIIVWMQQTDDLERQAAAIKTHLQSVIKGRDAEVQISQQLLEGMARQENAFSYLLGGLGVVSLLVGGVGIMNVMLMNVSERRREIGVRMAIGSRARDIRHLFLAEAAVLSVAGAVFGTVLGLVAAYAFVSFSGWTFSLASWSLPLGILSSLLVGLFFGLHPAMAAARLQPVQALRDD
jgi:putative ABC transport system permease protein